MVGRVTRGSIRGLNVFALALRECSVFFYSTDYCANTYPRGQTCRATTLTRSTR